MNANELMIGNLIFSDLYNNTPILVESICSINKDIFNLTTGEIPFTSLIPIPLTEEWLLDFGFYISNNSDITKWYSNNIFSVCRNKDYFHFRLIENRENLMRD